LANFFEKVAGWYFRLNGFMTMDNFIVHRDSRSESGPKTDADIFGVRFPFRDELHEGMKDDLPFRHQKLPLLVIAEITKGVCKLNGPWTKRADRNMQYVLKAIGAFEASRVDEVADCLYDDHVYENKHMKMQLFAIGSKINEDYATDRPRLQQLLFEDILSFIYQRFRTFRDQKREHQHWDEMGDFLYRAAQRPRDAFNLDNLEVSWGAERRKRATEIRR
jgi:hypothetical protein